MTLQAMKIRNSLNGGGGCGIESLGPTIDPIWQKRFPWDTEVDVAN